MSFNLPEICTFQIQHLHYYRGNSYRYSPWPSQGFEIKCEFYPAGPQKTHDFGCFIFPIGVSEHLHFYLDLDQEPEFFLLEVSDHFQACVVLKDYLNLLTRYASNLGCWSSQIGQIIEQICSPDEAAIIYSRIVLDELLRKES